METVSHYVSHTTTLEDIKCWTCGTIFAADADLLRIKRRDNDTLHCPNGCRLGFGESAEQKLRKEMEQKLAQAKKDKEFLEARLVSAREQRDKAEKSLTATRGVVTRIKNRAAKGLCPCCNRFFENVHRHIKHMHPDFVAEVAAESKS